MKTGHSLLHELFMAGDAGHLERFHEILHDDVIAIATRHLTCV